jgi:hypothetical protein
VHLATVTLPLGASLQLSDASLVIVTNRHISAERLQALLCGACVLRGGLSVPVEMSMARGACRHVIFPIESPPPEVERGTNWLRPLARHEGERQVGTWQLVGAAQ